MINSNALISGEEGKKENQSHRQITPQISSYATGRTSEKKARGGGKTEAEIRRNRKNEEKKQSDEFDDEDGFLEALNNLVIQNLREEIAKKDEEANAI